MFFSFYLDSISFSFLIAITSTTSNKIEERRYIIAGAINSWIIYVEDKFKVIVKIILKKKTVIPPIGTTNFLL